jgi:DnaT-like ssDNA binding protein
MTLVLETGAGIATANSYVDEDFFDTYCDDKSLVPIDGDTEAALIRATTALDNKYRSNYPGYRTLGRAQGLEWPRTAAYDYEGLVINTNEVPIEVKQATCEFALRELEEPGSVTPDLERGGYIRSIRAGSVGIDYGGSSNQTTYTIVDGIMAKILGPVTTAYNAKAVRG